MDTIFLYNYYGTPRPDSNATSLDHEILSQLIFTTNEAGIASFLTNQADKSQVLSGVVNTLNEIFPTANQMSFFDPSKGVTLQPNTRVVWEPGDASRLDKHSLEPQFVSTELSSAPEVSLPYGWEIVKDPQFGSFYIDHIHKRTQYEPPTPSDFTNAAGSASSTFIPHNNSSHPISTKSWPSSTRIPILSESQKPFLSTVNPSPLLYSPINSPPGTSYIPNKHRLPPNVFTTDVNQLNGPIVTTSFVKSPRGFGFTIIGGTDKNKPGFLQVKNLIPGGPAFLDGLLCPGDVLISIGDRCVLGYTHADIVALFQSMPVGTCVSLTVSQGYLLRFDVNDPSTKLITTLAVRSTPHQSLGGPFFADCLSAPPINEVTTYFDQPKL
ncbi:unnamed protein product [Protopolystoma xenopodis]|uniref:PDZ domain-containing protein n=1 Tax=Protopolystoma xenopodis TaxID=117903 RepID=A0A448WHP0_9PLAT|nr:unnamed protein product [Protopolystoma xenopodis]